jgi:TfoX N-terminal domain
MSDLSATKMAFSEVLAGRVRKYLDSFPDLKIEEKNLFSGIAFLVNGKMCVNVSGENLMCRYDPKLDEVVAERVGFQPMIMRVKTTEWLLPCDYLF